MDGKLKKLRKELDAVNFEIKLLNDIQNRVRLSPYGQKLYCDYQKEKFRIDKEIDDLICAAILK